MAGMLHLLHDESLQAEDEMLYEHEEDAEILIFDSPAVVELGRGDAAADTFLYLI